MSGLKALSIVGATAVAHVNDLANLHPVGSTAHTSKLLYDFVLDPGDMLRQGCFRQDFHKAKKDDVYHVMCSDWLETVEGCRTVFSAIRRPAASASDP